MLTQILLVDQGIVNRFRVIDTIFSTKHCLKKYKTYALFDMQDLYVFPNHSKVTKPKYYLNRLSKKICMETWLKNSTTTHMVNHMAIYRISQEGKVIVKPEPRLLKTEIKSILKKL